MALQLFACGGNSETPVFAKPSADPSAQGSSLLKAEEKTDIVRVAYIPLDDRPLNKENVVYLANSVGLEIEMPERELFATRLNGQGTNPNGTQHGDPEGLYEWLAQEEASGTDRYIISLDQLLSGGLVSSRDMTDIGNSLELLEKTVELLSSDPGNRVYFADSIMRLAPTVGYGMWNQELYSKIREYAKQPRRELPSDSDIYEIFENYSVSDDGSIIDAGDFGIDEETLSLYLSARKRKLSIASRLCELVSDKSNFSVLYGIDDSSNSRCIQANEIAYVENKLGNKGAVLSGVDDLGFKLVAKLYLDDHPLSPDKMQISVEYFGGKENEPACEYDFRPFSRIVENHVRYFGFSISDTENFKMIVLTATDSDKDQVLADFRGAIDFAASKDIPVIVTDACNNTYDGKDRTAVMSADLDTCISYDGQTDMANVAGISMSRGIARYAYLAYGECSDGADEAFKKTMADTLVRDMAFRKNADAVVNKYVRSLNGDPNNFGNPPVDSKNIEAYLSSEMTGRAGIVPEKLKSSKFIHSLNPVKYKKYGKLAVQNYGFPWNRTFEISFDIVVK